MQTLQKLFAQIADLFDIFDLSFFVSGAFVVAALSWSAETHGLEIPQWNTEIMYLLLALISYIAGMLCFALGRLARRALRPRARAAGPRLTRIIQQHGLAEHEVVRPYMSGAAPEALMARLWAEVRQGKDVETSLALLRRYWVSAATLDGVSTALVGWAVCLYEMPGGGRNALVVAIVCLALAFIASREAGRCEREQCVELVATIACLWTGAARTQTLSGSGGSNSEPITPLAGKVDAPGVASTATRALPTLRPPLLPIVARTVRPDRGQCRGMFAPRRALARSRVLVADSCVVDAASFKARRSPGSPAAPLLRAAPRACPRAPSP